MATDDKLKSDFNRLLYQTPSGSGSLGEPAPVPPIPESRGFGRPVSRALPPPTSSGGGVDSPLSESDYTLRTYYPDEIYTSADGLYGFVLRRISSMTLYDASGTEIVLNFAEPPATP